MIERTEKQVPLLAGWNEDFIFSMCTFLERVDNILNEEFWSSSTIRLSVTLTSTCLHATAHCGIRNSYWKIESVKANLVHALLYGSF